MNTISSSSSQSTCGGTCDVGGSAPAVKPDYRIERHDEGVTLHLALPGVSKDQVGVSLEQGLLTITGERTVTVPEAWKAPRELPHPATYKLVVRLHRELDPTSIRANLADGVLRLGIERHEAAKPRTIEVN